MSDLAKKSKDNVDICDIFMIITALLVGSIHVMTIDLTVFKNQLLQNFTFEPKSRTFKSKIIFEYSYLIKVQNYVKIELYANFDNFHVCCNTRICGSAHMAEH